MKSFITILFLSLTLSICNAQKIEKLKQEVLHDAFLLYKSEKASWHGSDLFLEKYTDRSKIGGYVSYTEGASSKCIFISKQDKNKVIGTITFDSIFNLNTATIDLTEREITSLEKDYTTLREKALERIKTDTIFKYYKNTNFNLVPIISGKEKKVYVLTGTNESRKFIIGNDYLIEFDKKGEINKTSRLHKGILVMEYGDKEKKMIGGIHTHLPGFCEIITPTDICTTMLYQDYTKWDNHTVLSQNYVSIWDCKKNILVVIKKEVWEKINNDK